MRNIYKYGLALMVSATLTTSCTKSFEDINTNPNSPVKAPLTNVLAYAIRDHAYQIYDVWGDMNEPSTYAGHLAKIQYMDEARYNYRTNTVENLWTYYSRDLKNLQLVIDGAKADGKSNMQATALTFQTLIWLSATDRWRDIPFTTALQGDAGVIAPTYSKQEDIYPELLSRLKTAADLFNKKGGDDLGAGDVLFKGDTGKWLKFANSLRLRIAIRISGVAPALAKTNVEEITGNPTLYPVITSNDDNAFLIWPGTLPYYEPWAFDQFNPAGNRDDHSVSDVLVDNLTALNDPRLSIYAKPATLDGVYRGALIGPTDAGQIKPISRYSRIGARFRDNRAGFTPFLRAAEVSFDLAEAASLGWNAGTTTSSAYNNGVTLSMDENGVSATDAATYLAGSGAYDGNIKTLYLQKWIALFKNGNEAWAETRRTDVPLLPVASGTTYTGHNRPPFRYPYPTTESQLNSANSAPYVSSVKDSFWGKQMWWDTRIGVN
ncbi:MAG TPA: SusD/RagB family nutrient-binding outer membrane lipoprotein [Pedobacter sp.]